MFLFFFKRTRLAGILTAAFFAVFLLFTACEQPGGVLHVHDDDATLRSLTVDRGTLSPPFSASHSEYRVTVRNANDAITVTAAASSGKAAVSGTGTKTLDVGSDNTITVGVRAESGVSKTYTITVRRLDASVFGIETAEDMAKIGVEDDWSPAREYILMNDITLENWSPICGGDDTAGEGALPDKTGGSTTGVGAFSGIFDGDGHTITLNSFDDQPVGSIYVFSTLGTTWSAAASIRQKVFLGIFGAVKGTPAEKAEIKNLRIHSTVDSTVNGAEGTAVGLVAAYGEYAVFDNITLSGTFNFTSASGKSAYVGGVVGFLRSAGTVISNCSSSMDMDIKPGYANGLIYGIPNPFSYVGGIAGYMEDQVGIENCHNTGDVKAISTFSGSQLMGGGILGGTYYAFSSSYHGWISDCSSTGDITVGAVGFWPMGGGIAGVICGGHGTLENSTRIVRSFATGTIKNASTGNTFPYFGGITGYVYFGAWVSQCYFDGTVIGEMGGQDYTGGIAGYNSYATANEGVPGVVEDCWSAGKVRGRNNAAGIVGQNQQNCVLRRSYSRAVIETNTGSSWGVGGITGLHASNLKDVTGTWVEWKTKAVTACVALNPSVTAAAGNNVKRVSHQTAAYADTSNTATMSNNYAWSGMDISTGGTYTPAIGVDEAGGADCDEKPTQAFYVSLGWDFTNVWKMGADGYPKLKWQK